MAIITVLGYEKEGTAENPSDKFMATINMTASSIEVTTLEGDRTQFYDADGNAISENALSDYVNVVKSGDEATVYQTADSYKEQPERTVASSVMKKLVQ